MPHLHSIRGSLAVAAAMLLAACTDTTAPDPAATSDTGPKALVAVPCRANLLEGRVSCGGPLPGNASSILIGGQHVYVTLTSSAVAVTADTIAFDVTITNLITQPLGSTDFSTLDPDGVRVFFMSAPTSTGAGTITVANPDGTGDFTASGQPYFQYNEVVQPDSTSGARRWKLQFTPEVTAFTFVVAVAADVPYPDGYILGNPYVLTLDPAEVRTLSGTVFSAVGNVLTGEPITWSSANPALVAMSGDQATAGAVRGFTEITPTSGPRPADYTTAVSVCQSVTVTNPHGSAQSIDATDCFSAFGSSQFRPSTAYYGDLYRVALTAGQTITITVDTGDVLDTYLILTDPIGMPAAVNDDDDDGVLGVGSRIVFTAPVSGTYVFEVSTFNGLDTGTYSLGVNIS